MKSEAFRDDLAARQGAILVGFGEPFLSILLQQVTESELQAALQLIRQKNAPPVNETPRGLLVVRDFDHRLGAWRG